MDKNTAYEIRRARDKDGVLCEHLPAENRAVRDEFWAFQLPFAAATGLPAANSANRKWLEAVAAAGQLDISRASDTQGNVLAYHVCLRTPDAAVLQYACASQRRSADTAARALVGRANRFLFWSDLLRFKEDGLCVYDFGGWYGGDSDQHLLNINRFKEGFGGQVIKYFKVEKGITWKGRLASWVKNIRAARKGRKAS